MTDRKDPFEEELRAALRSDGDRTQHPDTADDAAQLLDRIHRGAARRRSRRRAGALAATAVLSSAILVTLPLLTPPPSPDGNGDVSVSDAGPDDPDRSGRAESNDGTRHRPGDRSADSSLEARRGLSSRIEPGVEVEVADVKVTSVSGASNEEIWLSGYGTCDGDRPCNVLGHSSNGGADFDFTTLPGAVHSRQTTVRFSADGEIGWATDGGDVFRTDSGGRSWIPLEAPRDVRVATLEAWEDEVWTVGSEPATRETVVLSNRRGSERLVAVERAPDFAPTAAVALGSRAFGVARLDSERNFAHTANGGKRWTAGAIGCEPADVSAKEDTAWALCGDFDGVARSVDQGKSWLPPEMLDSTAMDSSMRIAAIDSDTAFIAGSEGGWVVESQNAIRAEGLADRLYLYAGFATEDVGYVIGYDGHLCRTTDGGYSWEPVELP